MTRTLSPVLMVCAAIACGAQPLPEDVVFDDFTYGSIEWVPTFSGTPEDPELGPPGSLYGPNPWVVSTDGETENRRLWYRYGWHGSGFIPEARTLEPSARGLRFSIASGDRLGDGCVDETVSTYTASPHQIATGFTARRGTWVSHVRLGTLPQPDKASMMHSFWLIATARGWTRRDGQDESITNEVDHEWNNRFLGADQSFSYSATGAYLSIPSRHKFAAMGALNAAPEVDSRLHVSVVNAQGARGPWACTYTRDGSSRALAPEACAALLEGRGVRGLTAPEGDVWTTLVMQVSDTGTRFQLVSDGWGARVEMRSRELSPAPDLPLLALLSQHLYPGGDSWTCADRAELRESPVFEADWFLYSANSEMDREAALRTVEQIRARGVSRLATVPDVRLERPERPLVGYAGDWGEERWTTPLALDLTFPRVMSPGERTRILALPPERLGSYRYTWTLETRYDDGSYETETHDDAFGLNYTFPRGAKTVLLTIRLEEVYDDLRVVRNDTVQPIERMFMIRRR